MEILQIYPKKMEFFFEKILNFLNLYQHFQKLMAAYSNLYVLTAELGDEKKVTYFEPVLKMVTLKRNDFLYLFFADFKLK